MVKTDKLFKIIEDEGIELVYQPLPNILDGMYHFIGKIFYILIDEGIVLNERLFRTVLAEEIGHYYTCNWDSVTRRRASIQGLIKYERAELKAHRWAANFMIPTDMLLAVLDRLKLITMPELSHIFDVEEHMIVTKLEAMAAIQHTWNLANGKSLVLTNLPDVYLYEAF